MTTNALQIINDYDKYIIYTIELILLPLFDEWLIIALMIVC